MKKILLLDDNEELCKLMQSMFSSFGVTNVSCFRSCEEVEKLPLSELPSFNLAFLDVNLGVNARSGIDAFNWIIQNGFKGDIVFLTGHARSYPLLKKSLEYPNVKLLEKPADISVLESIIFS